MQGGISTSSTPHTDRLLLLVAATLTLLLPNPYHPTLATLLCHLTQLLHTLLNSARPSLHQPATLLDQTLPHSPQFYSTESCIQSICRILVLTPLFSRDLDLLYNSVPLFNSNTYTLFITISLLYSTKLVLNVYNNLFSFSIPLVLQLLQNSSMQLILLQGQHFIYISLKQTASF